MGKESPFALSRPVDDLRKYSPAMAFSGFSKKARSLLSIIIRNKQEQLVNRIEPNEEEQMGRVFDSFDVIGIVIAISALVRLTIG